MNYDFEVVKSGQLCLMAGSGAYYVKRLSADGVYLPVSFEGVALRVSPSNTCIMIDFVGKYRVEYSSGDGCYQAPDPSFFYIEAVDEEIALLKDIESAIKDGNAAEQALLSGAITELQGIKGNTAAEVAALNTITTKLTDIKASVGAGNALTQTQLAELQGIKAVLNTLKADTTSIIAKLDQLTQLVGVSNAHLNDIKILLGQLLNPTTVGKLVCANKTGTYKIPAGKRSVMVYNNDSNPMTFQGATLLPFTPWSITAEIGKLLPEILINGNNYAVCEGE